MAISRTTTLNLERWWPGTSNNCWNIDDLVKAYSRVKGQTLTDRLHVD
jgi:hypothetical protein